jgi:hypothetical protein
LISPDSLGLLYSAITGYLGFEVNEGEYKVMGLAPYGQPKYLKQIGQLIEAGPGGEYRPNLKYYSFLQQDRMARALQFWPECAEIMLRVVDFQTRRVRIMACKSAIELFELDKLGTLRYLLRGGEQRLDLVLSEAVVKSVSAIGFVICRTLAARPSNPARKIDRLAGEEDLRSRRQADHPSPLTADSTRRSAFSLTPLSTRTRTPSALRQGQTGAGRHTAPVVIGIVGP